MVFFCWKGRENPNLLSDIRKPSLLGGGEIVLMSRSKSDWEGQVFFDRHVDGCPSIPDVWFFGIYDECDFFG